MSSAKDNAQQPQPISREDILLEVGEQLKSERHKASISIDVVANALNLRTSYIKGLEAGDWTEMPGEVYASAFLRQYADYLQLDVNASMEKLKSGDYHLTKPLTFPDPPVAPSKTWMIVAALLFVLLSIGFNVLNHTPAPLPSQLMQDSAKHMKSLEKASIPNAEEPKPTKEKPLAVKTTVPTPSSSNKESMPKATLKVKPTANVTNIDSKKISSYVYKLTAVTSDVWLQLHNSSEPPALIREALLKKGETMRVTYPKPLRLTSGNTLSLKIDLNNQVIIQANQLGEKGKVLRNYLLQKEKNLP